MRTAILMSLILAILVTGITFLLPPLYVLNRKTNVDYHGFPLPWAYSQNAYSWIPIIGPILTGVLTDFDIFCLTIDIAFWFGIIAVIFTVKAKATDNA